MFDRAAIMACVEGDIDLFREVAAVYMEHLPVTLQRLRDGISRGDSAVVKRLAHSLKGASAVFGPSAAVDAALQLEMLALQNNLEAAVVAYRALDAETQRLAEIVRQIAEAEMPAPPAAHCPSL